MLDQSNANQSSILLLFIIILTLVKLLIGENLRYNTIIN
jgi:hypothetical protein